MMTREQMQNWPPTPGVEVWTDERFWNTHTSYDQELGEYVTRRYEGKMKVPSVRWFEGPVQVAYKAAERYAELMRKRIGQANVYLVDSDGDHWQPRHWKGPEAEPAF